MGRDLYSIRATGVWRITDQTEAWLSYEKFDEDDDRMFVHNRVCKTSPVPADACVPGEFALEPAHAAYTVGTVPGRLGIVPLGAGSAETGLTYQYPRPEITDLRKVHIDYEPAYRFDQDLWQLGVSHEFDRARLSFIAGYQDWTWRASRDLDWSVGPRLSAIPGNPTGLWPVSTFPDGVNGLHSADCNVDEGLGGVNGGCLFDAGLDRLFGYADADEERDQWSFEVKLRTDLEGRFNLLVGAIYQDSDSHFLETFSQNLDETWTNPGGNAFITPGPLFRQYPGFRAGEPLAGTG